MYKVENCNGEFYCLLDVLTTMPPLLALRWLEEELLQKALGTQKSYLDSLKLFYDFWLSKYSVSLDFSFHQNEYRDVEVLTNELSAFWDYLLADKQISNVMMFQQTICSQTDLIRKKRTASKHCQVVCKFISYLSSTYLTTAYIDEDPIRLRRYRTDVKLRIKEFTSKFSKWQKSNTKISAYDSLNSLTSQQYKDFIRVLTPDVMKPVQVKLPNGRVEFSFTLVSNNDLNPIVSYEVQMRNYLLTTLLVKYGLRIGESLLLRKQSFMPLRSDSKKMIMRVRNLEGEKFGDSKIDDMRTYKPQIKTKGSIRDLEITLEDFRKIDIYFKFIRPNVSEHDFVFTAPMRPYKPISYTTIQSQFASVVTAFKEQFPEHFEPNYAESIKETITPHWLRHTWAYATLSSIYNKKKEEYIKSGVVNLKGLMEDAQAELRVLGGWSKKSVMPTKYAKRFIQEQANKTLMDVYRNHYTTDNVLSKELFDASTLNKNK